MLGDGTRQTKKQTYLGCPRRGWVQHRHFHGAPPVFQRVHRQNENDKGQRLGIFQASIYYKPATHAGNTRHESGSRTHQCVKRYGIARRGNSRRIGKSQRIVSKNCSVKSGKSKSQRTTEPAPNSPKFPSSDTDSKGGKRTTSPTSRAHSKGAGHSNSG